MPNLRRPLGQELARILRRRGITDPRVLGAIAAVPRDHFVPRDLRASAWDDRALPIGSSQTISQPYMVALMTQELDLTGSECVLEIGTGSGYQTAILALLAREVFTIERIEDLSRTAEERLRASIDRAEVHFRVGDGTLGWPDAAPFDRILVTAAAPELPGPLFEQLRDGGRIVVPIGAEDYQTLHVIDRRGDSPVESRSVDCRFVPLIGQEGW